MSSPILRSAQFAGRVARSATRRAPPLDARLANFSTRPPLRKIWEDANAEAVAERLAESHPHAGKLALLDFSATWCPPCHMLSPILKAVHDRKDIDLLVVDVDKEPELSQRFKVRAMPTVVALRGGQEISRFVGALGEPQVEQFVDDVSK